MKKNIFGVLVSILFCTSIHAQTFTFENINYKITDANKKYVEVGSNTLFIGAADIPNMVNDNNNNIVYTVTAISNRAFESSDLTSVTIPDSVTSIGDYAFVGLDLTSVTIPDSVTSIGEGAFYNCANLTNVTIIGSIDGNSATSIGAFAFDTCTSLKSVTIPDSVTIIGFRAFHNCTDLKSVTIPNSVISIGDFAFFKCASLTSVTIGSSVTSIGDFAFAFCSKLISVISLKPTPPTLAGTTFESTTYDVGTLVVPNASLDAYKKAGVWSSFKNIKPLTFAFENINYNITNATNSYVEVGGNTSFSGAADIPTTVTNGMDYTVTAISEGAFFECTSLTSVTIPDSVTSIDNYTFFECTSLTSVTIPDSVISIGKGAFEACTSLTSVTIGNSVTSIGESAFETCTSLTSFTIPDSVTSIGESAFEACTSLTSVTSLNLTPPKVANTNAFDTATYAGTLYVPAGSKVAYGAADFWKYFKVAVLNIEQLNEVTVMVYPNPVVETLYIQLQPNDSLTSVTLHNIKGQKILKSTTKIIDLSSLTSGVYFATILTKNGKATKKIIK